jgi:hypothetical protein
LVGPLAMHVPYLGGECLAFWATEATAKNKSTGYIGYRFRCEHMSGRWIQRLQCEIHGVRCRLGWLVAVVVSTGTAASFLFASSKRQAKKEHPPSKMFLTTLLLTATTVSAAPVFLYSHDASLLAGRNHYVDRGFTTKELFALHQTQDPLVFNKSPASSSSASSPSLLSLILVTEEPTDTFANSDNWLKQQYTAAPSSVVLPRYVHDNALAVAATQNEEVYSFKGTNYQHLARQIAQTLLDVPTTSTIVVPVQSLQNTGEFVDVGEFIIFYIFWGSSHRTHHFLLSSPPQNTSFKN